MFSRGGTPDCTKKSWFSFCLQNDDTNLRGDCVICWFLINPLPIEDWYGVGSKLMYCMREYAVPLMALPREVAVRFAHIHNTPSSHTLSV